MKYQTIHTRWRDLNRTRSPVVARLGEVETTLEQDTDLCAYENHRNAALKLVRVLGMDGKLLHHGCDCSSMVFHLYPKHPTEEG